MMGRVGRRERTGHAVAIVRPSDNRSADELASALREEQLPGLISHFERANASWPGLRGLREANVKAVATHIAAHLAHCPETGSTVEELQEFFARTLSGEELAQHVPSALAWLSDPMRVLAYRGENDRYALTTLGLAATRAVLPLNLAAGLAQLLRDLLTLDPSDQLLAAWRPLDHLIILGLLFDLSPKVGKFNASLPDKLHSWMSSAPERASLLHNEWISGPPGASRACEVLGSLGLQPSASARDSDEWARKQANLAVLQAAILYELSQGATTVDLERQWELRGLSGIEERWRDDFSWLLSGAVDVPDLRYFYYHLREECAADSGRAKRVKKALLRIRSQTFELIEHLSYCSPLGPILRAIRVTNTGCGEGRSVGIRSIRRLEEAEIRSLEDLATIETDDLVRLGIRRNFAKQIRAYVSEARHRLPEH